MTYAYTPFGEVKTKTDSHGNVSRFEYDLVGNLLRRIDPLGQETTFDYDPAGNVTAVVDALGQATTFSYDEKNQLIRAVEPNGAVTQIDYTADGTVAAKTDPSGAVSRQTFTPTGNVLTTTSPAGGETTRTYSAAGNATGIEDPLGHDSTTGFNAAGLPTEFVDALGGTVNVEYAFSRISRKLDPNGNATSYTYDRAGQLTSTSDPRGGTTATEYDANGNVAALVNELGARQEFHRDDAGRLTEVIDYANQAWEITYDGGRLDTVTSPSGVVTEYSFDAANRLTEMVTQGGERKGFDRDALGRIIAISDGAGNTTTYRYDEVGQPVEVRNADGSPSTYSYDPAGRLTSSTDPVGNTTTYEYDSGGRLSAESSTSRGTVSYTHNARDELVARTTAAGTTTFDYDPLGRLEHVDRPGLTADESYEYDAAGNLTKRVDGAGTAIYRWDTTNRLSSMTLPSSAVVTYTRDISGNVTRQTLDGDATEYERDPAGRLVRLTTAGSATSYAYTPTSRPASVQYPGSSLALEWDGSDRLTKITDATGTSAYVRDSSGRVVTARTPRGDHGFEYSPAGRLIAWTAPGGVRTGYLYDARGNITDIVRSWTDPSADGSTPPGIRGQIEDCLASHMADCSNPQIAWAIGHLTTPTPTELPSEWNGVRRHVANYFALAPQVVERLAYDSSSRLTGRTSQVSGESISYSYDTRGNQTTSGTHDRTFDEAGRLQSTSVGGQTFQFAYDALHRLTAIEGPTGRATFDRDDSGRIVRLSQDDGGTARIVYDDFGPHSIQTPSGAFIYQFNQHGDVTALTDLGGVVKVSYDYSPWGDTVVSGDAILAELNPYTFNGQELVTSHPDLGLFNMHHRWYDPRQLRFISADSLPSQPHLADQPYAYAAHDPVNLSDPTGTLAWGVNTRQQTEHISNALQPVQPTPITPVVPQPGLERAGAFAPPVAAVDESRYRNPRELPEYQGAYVDTEQVDLVDPTMYGLAILPLQPDLDAHARTTAYQRAPVYYGIFAAGWAKMTVRNHGDDIPGWRWPIAYETSRCTHFVSTAMWYGYLRMKNYGKDKENVESWWYRSDGNWIRPNASWAWGASENLRDHVRLEGHPYASYKNWSGDLSYGDLIFIRKKPGQNLGHTEMVTGGRGQNIRVTQQGRARHNILWRDHRRMWKKDFPDAKFIYINLS